MGTGKRLATQGRLATAQPKLLFTIYAVAFSAPALYRGTGELAKAVGCSPTTQLILAYGAFGLVGLATWWLTLHSKLAPSMHSIVAPHRHGLPALLCNPMLILASVIAIISTSLIIGPFGKDMATLDDGYSATYRISLILGAALVVPAAEELGGRWLLYRGLRPNNANHLNGLKRLAATAPAILISAAAFGLFHYMVAGPTRMATTALVGIIFAISYEWSGTLAVPLATHIFINARAQLTADLGLTSGRTIAIAAVAAFTVPALMGLAQARPHHQ